VSSPNCVWDAKAELGEGVFWHPKEQAVYWVDIVQSKLHRMTDEGTQQTWHFDGRASAVVPCEAGGLLATFESGLSHINLETETVTPLLPLEIDSLNNRFNDGYTDNLGNFWFGSMDDTQQAESGHFYRMLRNGTVTRLDNFGAVCISNGPAFSTDGNWVYFTDTITGKIFRAELDANNNPGQPELHIDFGELKGHPDGMCTDTAGGLWVCHFAGGCITRFLQNGEVDQVIELPVPNITKCAFGGKELRTLYITTAALSLDDSQRKAHPLSGGLFKVDVPFQGVPVVAAPLPKGFNFQSPI